MYRIFRNAPGKKKRFSNARQPQAWGNVVWEIDRYFKRYCFFVMSFFSSTEVRCCESESFAFDYFSMLFVSGERGLL